MREFDPFQPPPLVPRPPRSRLFFHSFRRLERDHYHLVDRAPSVHLLFHCRDSTNNLATARISTGRQTREAVSGTASITAYRGLRR